MTQRLDAISRLLNSPTMGEDIRRAIAQSRRDACPSAADEEEPELHPVQNESGAVSADTPQR